MEALPKDCMNGEKTRIYLQKQKKVILLDELLLIDIPLFSRLDRVDMAKLIPELEKNSFSSGEILFNQGDNGDSLFIIVNGTAKVFYEQNGKVKDLNFLGPGEYFGEMALLTGEPRSAGIQAVTDLTVFKLSKERFKDIIKKHHSLAIHFNELLARRLAATNYDFGKAQYSNIGDNVVKEPPPVPYDTTPKTGTISRKVLYKNFAIVATGALLCFGLALLLKSSGLEKNHVIIIELLLAATICWSLNLISFHVVSVALPLLAVLLGAAPDAKAFSGFSSPTWFLIIGVFAIAAAISRTGLLFRMALLIIKRFPQGYTGQTLALALTGLALTPIIPSANGRVALSSPLALNISEALHFKNFSPGAVGIAMSCLLGFGHMSFMFMNGTPANLLVFGLLPAEISSGITWGYWLKTALPMGIIFFALSYFAIIMLYRPGMKISLNHDIIEAQIKTLGPITFQEKISLITVIFSILAFVTEPWHHIKGAWIALFSFLVLFGSSVLDERAVRQDIDWNFLISFGALIGFGNVMSSSGLTGVIAGKVSPYLGFFSGNKLVFLLVISISFYLLRLALPSPPAQLISMLSIVPVASATGINPFIIGLVILISGNPWFLPHQDTVYLNAYYGMEERAFRHRQTLPLAFLHFVISLIAIAISIPYWQSMGLIR